MLTPAKAALKQGRLLLEAARERHIAPAALTLDHAQGNCTVSGRDYPLIFPAQFACRTAAYFLREAAGRPLLASFRGHEHPNRRTELAAVRQLPNVRVIFDNQGRRQVVCNKAYLDDLGSSRLVLCPGGSFPWSYRFFEAILCGAIPVVREPCSQFDGYRYHVCTDWSEVADLPYRRDWVDYNYAYLLQRHFLSSSMKAVPTAHRVAASVLPALDLSKTRGNVGDRLGLYLYKKLTNHAPRVAHVQTKDTPQPAVSLVGSILHRVWGTGPQIVWGAGAIDGKQPICQPGAKIHGVRGPLSAARAMLQHQRFCRVVSDPGLFLSAVYDEPQPVLYDVGYVLHSIDSKQLRATNQLPSPVLDSYCGDVEQFVNQLRQYRRIISSSLHGCIIAHAYGIPVLPVSVTGELAGGNWKFRDYWASAGLAELYMPTAKTREALLALQADSRFVCPDPTVKTKLQTAWLAGFNQLFPGDNT